MCKYKQVINSHTLQKFKNELADVNWQDVFIKDINYDFQQFSSIFNELYKKCFPIKCYHTKSQHKPWITKAIINSIKFKNLLYKQY